MHRSPREAFVTSMSPSSYSIPSEYPASRVQHNEQIDGDVHEEEANDKPPSVVLPLNIQKVRVE